MTMSVSNETISKMNSLSNEDMSIVANIIDQMASKPIDIFHDLREEGLKNPMTEDEIDDFVESVRKERRANRC